MDIQLGALGPGLCEPALGNEAPATSLHLLPRREAGHMAVSLWPLPAPCYLGELSWAAGLSRLVHCSSWS